MNAIRRRTLRRSIKRAILSVVQEQRNRYDNTEWYEPDSGVTWKGQEVVEDCHTAFLRLEKTLAGLWPEKGK